METFYGLKETGQISDGFFTFILNITTGDLTIEEAVQKYREIISTYERDVNDIYNQYITSSFSKDHNVLLVAHSQGNIIGNKIFTKLTEKQAKKFRMVSVGTPADHVMKPGQTIPYVTLMGDLVILSVPGSLTANTSGGGHNFIANYMGRFESRIKIASYVKTAYDELRAKATCNTYDYIYLNIYYRTATMQAYGKITGVNANEVVATDSIESFSAASGCPQGYQHIYFHPEVSLHSNYAVWNISPFLSQDEVSSHKGKSITYQFGNNCFRYTFEGDMYDTVYDAL